MTASDPMTGNRTQTIEIPGRTASEISKRLRGTEFESVDEYVAFALDLLLRELDRPDTGGTQSDPESSSSTTEKETIEGASDEAVADRLESLGYL